MEKRKFKRLGTNLIVKIKGGRRLSTTVMKKILEPRIKNISYGGVYIETLTPFRRNSIVEVDFWLPDFKGQVHAKGIVRWSNTEKKPLGMGIEFVEVSIKDKSKFNNFVENVSMTSMQKKLTQTPIHLKILKIYKMNLGKEMDYNQFISNFGVSRQEVEDAMRPFIIEGMISRRGSFILFNRTTDPDIQKLIDNI